MRRRSAAQSGQKRHGRVTLVEIGVDIVEIGRIRKSIGNPRFLKRVFATHEVAYCRSRKNAAQHFAVRFAAKEAVWKAVASAVVRLSSGKRVKGAKLLHRDIQVLNHSNGKPRVILPVPYRSLAEGLSISLSHGRDYAVAVAIYEKA